MCAGFTPVLTAQAEGVFNFRNAQIFGIEENEIYAPFGFFAVKDACQFQDDTHAAGAIVCREDGIFWVFVILICHGSAIPVGGENHAFFGFRVDATDEVIDGDCGS